jgi:AP2-like factor (euAP2 lineage)
VKEIMNVNQSIRSHRINQKRASVNKYRGCHYFYETKKYQVQVGFKGKLYYMGYFADEIEAAQVYDIAAKRFFGEYACLNFPDKYSEISEELKEFVDDVIDYYDKKLLEKPRWKAKPLHRTGYRGVTWVESFKKYRAIIIYKTKSLYLGLFDNVIDAAKAYDKYAIRYHKDKAKLNFPNDYPNNKRR